uniref:Uncharacterized protein n=1 Tax=Alexandrium catenella TaxID=2925 RepID=A0A7S1WV76_ALECA|mmetsp:Transcript_92566/g.245881  ORF Transcript_92566/g.245881 Transcript_92566/m.245881 type:complete len:562 (+) Transcript_92566:81-1766(+)
MAAERLAALFLAGCVWHARALRTLGLEERQALSGVNGPDIVPDEELKYPDCAGVECVERYVKLEDNAYSWHRLNASFFGKNRENTSNWTAILINMTSQKWMTEADTDHPIWWHFLAIITPSNLGELGTNTTDWATLLVGFLDPKAGVVDENAVDLRAAGDMAMATGTQTAVLFRVPNSPVAFANDPVHAEKNEEEMKAWSWMSISDHPERPEYAIEVPMTKAIVKAMDTVQQAASGAIRRFVVTGFSKRGLATWLVGAIDKRVKAIMAGSHMLAIRDHGPQAHMSYGHMPLAAEAYAKLPHRMDLHPDEPSGKSLYGIIDPASNTAASDVYMSRLAGLQKLIMEPGNDDFAIVDNSKNWLHKIRGQKTYVIGPNLRHVMGYRWDNFLVPAIAFLQGVILKQTIPEISWSVDNVTGAIHVRQESDHVPVRVKLWTAETCPAMKRRDFRKVTADNEDVCKACGGKYHEEVKVCENRHAEWHSQDLAPEAGKNGTSGLVWRAAINAPPEGWRAGFIEMVYRGPRRQEPYIMTTQVSVMPKEYPFPECLGDDCKKESHVLVLVQK